jgi:hypothetical protein
VAKGLSPLQHAILRTLAGRPSLHEIGELANGLSDDVLSFKAREPRVARNSLRRALYRLWERGLILRTEKPCKNPNTGRVALAWGLATEEVLDHNFHLETNFIVSPACRLDRTDDPRVPPDPIGTPGEGAGTAAHPMASIAVDEPAISAMSDNDAAAGGSPPTWDLFANLFAADSDAQKRVAPPMGAKPIGLGDASAVGAGLKPDDLGSLLRHLFDAKEQLRRCVREHGLQGVLDELIAEHGHKAVSAAVKRSAGQPPLTAKQIRLRQVMVVALRRHGCPSEAAAAKIIAAAHGENPESMRTTVRNVRCRADELGITAELERIPDEDLRWLADRLRAAARLGGKKLPGFLSTRNS